MRFDGRLISGVGIFASVVETGSFVRTSEVVGLTTSGVSRAIGRLEERLGVRLFHRSPRGITVTEDGRRFYDQALPLIERLAQSADEMRACGQDAVGTLRVHADSASSSHFLIPALRDFMEAYPRVDVQLEVRERPSDLTSDPCDLAVHLGDAEWAGLVGEHLFDSPMIVCASPSYADDRGTPTTPQELSAPPHMCLVDLKGVGRRNPHWVFRLDYEKVVVEGERRLTCSTPMTAFAAALGGMGIARLPKFLVEESLATGRLVRFLDGWHAGLTSASIYRPMGAALTPRTRAFADFLRMRVREMGHSNHRTRAITPAVIADPVAA
ncbi:LysR family transcriptional regulator [Microvirga roseola]|uniref:LysR family transcriptional regulator n=1 Tax=Microvirga roseola TaxID=2883126 RepID=UPI0022A89210|nr:LysR family transcriptional regulator [Microvirga roseola]